MIVLWCHIVIKVHHYSLNSWFYNLRLGARVVIEIMFTCKARSMTDTFSEFQYLCLFDNLSIIM
uniref:Uncharacterized protein n=1 Tax=Arundo donax TaxID=35708 RepID=A0A0A9EX19_ARUDO